MLYSLYCGIFSAYDMPFIRILLLAALTMTAFAGNSILCRLALQDGGIDAASFTLIRLISGTITLVVIVYCQSAKSRDAQIGPITQVAFKGDWFSGFALFTYAAGFSLAYTILPAATGALILFGAAQATMISYGFTKGERLSRLQSLGLIIALLGFIGLLLPGLAAPPLKGAALMIIAGLAWGIYSIRGKTRKQEQDHNRSGDAHPAITMTAGNFLRACLFASALSAALLSHFHVDGMGILYGISSGAIASAMGYSLWYTLLPYLKSTHAAVIQLSVPAIAALGGAAFLGEAITLPFMLAAITILGGIALVFTTKKVSSNK